MHACVHDPVVHEILGHVASAEGVVGALLDLHRRGVCRPGALFVPQAAGTMLCPTSPLQLSMLEGLVHRHIVRPF
jgi:hypothetical protein